MSDPRRRATEPRTAPEPPAAQQSIHDLACTQEQRAEQADLAARRDSAILRLRLATQRLQHPSP